MNDLNLDAQGSELVAPSVLTPQELADYEAARADLRTVGYALFDTEGEALLAERIGEMTAPVFAEATDLAARLAQTLDATGPTISAPSPTRSRPCASRTTRSARSASGGARTVCRWPCPTLSASPRQPAPPASSVGRGVVPGAGAGGGAGPGRKAPARLSRGRLLRVRRAPAIAHDRGAGA